MSHDPSKSIQIWWGKNHMYAISITLMDKLLWSSMQYNNNMLNISESISVVFPIFFTGANLSSKGYSVDEGGELMPSVIRQNGKIICFSFLLETVNVDLSEDQIISHRLFFPMLPNDNASKLAGLHLPMLSSCKVLWMAANPSVWALFFWTPHQRPSFCLRNSLRKSGIYDKWLRINLCYSPSVWICVCLWEIDKYELWTRQYAVFKLHLIQISLILFFNMRLWAGEQHIKRFISHHYR